MCRLKSLKTIVTGFVWTLASVYLALAVLTHLPPVQRFLGTQVGGALGRKLGTSVLVGRVNLGFFNRIIVDDVCIYDQRQEKMLTAARLSAKFDYVPLLQGRVSVSSAQVFGLKANLYRQTASSAANFQFVIDSLASRGTTQGRPLDLAIHSLVIRHGDISYILRDEAVRPGLFSLRHLRLHDISAHVLLNRLKEDSLDIGLKTLSFVDESGLRVERLRFGLVANGKEARLTDFELRLPRSRLRFDDVTATYVYEGKRLEWPSFQMKGSLVSSQVTPSDISCFLPTLSHFANPVNVSARFNGTATSLFLHDLNVSTANRSIDLQASGSVSIRESKSRWAALVKRLHLGADGMRLVTTYLGKQPSLPAFVERLGSIDYVGRLGGYGSDLSSKGMIRTDAGRANLAFGKHGRQFSARLETKGIDIRRVLDDGRFGLLAAHLHVDGTIPKDRNRQLSLIAKGNIDRIDYNSYSYRNLTLDGEYRDGTASGTFAIDDPHAKLRLQGSVRPSPVSHSVHLTADVDRLNPQALHLYAKWPGAVFTFHADADFQGSSPRNTHGSLDVTGFSMQAPGDSYACDGFHLRAEQGRDGNHVTLSSDFASVDITGQYDFASLPQSLANLIGSKLPTLPGLPRLSGHGDNDFRFQASLLKSDILNKMLGIPLEISKPVTAWGNINDHTHELNMRCDVPSFSYDGTRFRNGFLRLATVNDSLKATASVDRLDADGHTLDLRLDATAIDNTLSSILSFNNNRQRRFQGNVDMDTRFFKNADGHNAAHVTFHPSSILVGDTTWTVQPSDVVYSNNRLAVDHFSVEHNSQHITVAGFGSAESSDSLYVDLKDIDISYILNLVNFHSVGFSGRATGRAYVASLFNRPAGRAHLTVDDFRFEDGRMGVLAAQVDYDQEEGQINIDAIAREDGRKTDIQGYVSPRKNSIDLAITAHHTRGEFLESFCGAFMDRTDLSVDGTLHVVGPLSSINLVGKMTAEGTARVIPINAVYRLEGDTITFVPDEIRFENDTVRDRHGHLGIINGTVHHRHLTNFTADLGISTSGLLVYDFDGSDGSTFYGTVYGTGGCNLRTRSGEMAIDVDVTPDEGSQIVYNVSSPESVSNSDFIHWSSRDTLSQAGATRPSVGEGTGDAPDIPTDIHINFLIHTSPVATLKLIMDDRSGDYIALNGTGTLRATYFNKGGVDIFGNYVVDHGVYKLTIQDIIKRDFIFANGGTIAFGGDPYDAVLNLTAQYALNSVSLSDLNMGRSFSSNNIPVNCLMDITGTPKAPKVSFGLDLPTVGTDVKQAITSLINSEEEMNQQVLYLLAVGRFYAQGSNNAPAENAAQQSQTSLAMQSILSGQISQQLNTVLGNVINNTNWNIGANISTGDAGFDNAEYEGLLSGRLLNNRLLINGQFGYRDNANATTSFIGDFDVRYLLYPNGNFAIRVYNQTNDRYFTRNSLTTQGLGFILKKDFNGWRDLLGIKKKGKGKKAEKGTD